MVASIPINTSPDKLTRPVMPLRHRRFDAANFERVAVASPPPVEAVAT